MELSAVPKNVLEHLLDAAGPSSQTPYHQNIYEDRYRLRQALQSRQSCTVFSLKVLAPLLAIVYVVTICAFRSAREAHPLSLAVRRKLSEGREAEQSGESSAGSNDSCGYITLHAGTSAAKNTISSLFFPTEAKRSKPQDQISPRKKRKKTSSGESKEHDQRASGPADPSAEPLDPLLEAYIADALQAGDKLNVADWLLDPDKTLPLDLISGEEVPPFSAKEGTNPSPEISLHAAPQPAISPFKIYIDEELQNEGELDSADWLVDPREKKDSSPGLVSREKESRFFPKEGTCSFSRLLHRAASGQQAKAPFKLQLSPGDAMSSASRERFQLAQSELELQRQLPSSGGSEDGELLTAEVRHGELLLLLAAASSTALLHSSLSSHTAPFMQIPLGSFAFHGFARHLVQLFLACQ